MIAYAFLWAYEVFDDCLSLMNTLLAFGGDLLIILSLFLFHGQYSTLIAVDSYNKTGVLPLEQRKKQRKIFIWTLVVSSLIYTTFLLLQIWYFRTITNNPLIYVLRFTMSLFLIIASITMIVLLSKIIHLNRKLRALVSEYKRL